MNRRATPTRVLITYSIVGLAAGALLSYAFVWQWLDAYRWNPDGTLNEYPLGLTATLSSQGRLTREERVRIGCRESAPILVTVTFIGFCAGLVHLRVRDAGAHRVLRPEHEDFDDAPRRYSTPPKAGGP